MKVLIIGDTHGYFEAMDQALERIDQLVGPFDKVLHVGDFGYHPNINYKPSYDMKCPMWFIRGNHERHEYLALDATQPTPVWNGLWSFVPDGYMEDGILYLGGASSVLNQDQKTIEEPTLPSYWWKHSHQEEISIEKQTSILELLKKSDLDLKLVLSHDCPHGVSQRIHGMGAFTTSTGSFLEKVLDTTQVPRWIFGHHHMKVEAKYKSTRFTGLTQRSSMIEDVNGWAIVLNL